MNKKLSKIKNILQNRGIIGLILFIQQNISLKLISKIEYSIWLFGNKFNKQNITEIEQEVSKWKLKPKFSVIMPVYNVDAKWLEKAIESVRNQVYPNWELCIADDASPKEHIGAILKNYSKLDSRIKVVLRTENGNISAASNSALELATGDYVALLDHDDELTSEALYENAKLINQHPDADFIYSDEDKIDIKGNYRDPFFKPSWSPEYFYSCMYSCHLGVYRTSLVKEIGGFRSKFDGSQDYDLVLRIVEKTKNIYHIPKILYHWRIIPSSAASGAEAKPWAYIAGKQALQSMVDRSSYPGIVERTENPGIYRVKRNIPNNPLISIVIFCSDSENKIRKSPKKYQNFLDNCLRSINKLSTYKNYEIIFVTNSDTYNYFSDTANSNFKHFYYSESTNTPGQINLAVTKTKGEFLLLLNVKAEVINSDWIESMLQLAQQKEIGAVGAKILSPDKRLEHTGVVFLMGYPYNVFYGFDAQYPGYHCSNITNRNYLAVRGTCLMVRRELFNQIRGLNEDLPINLSDIDLCLKIHKAGFRNVVTPFTQITIYSSNGHHDSLTSSDKQKFSQQWNKYLNELGRDPYYNPNLSLNSPNFKLL